MVFLWLKWEEKRYNEYYKGRQFHDLNRNKEKQANRLLFSDS